MIIPNILLLHFFVRVELINSHLRETSRENETKVEQITKKVNTIEERLSRMEEYTIQVLDMLANIHDPHTSPPGETEDASGEGDAWKSESEEMISRRLPQRMFSRMMSVPAYVHRANHAGSSSSLRSTPMYFRHKVPHSNPYPSWYRQASNYGNWRRKSLQKAIRKFKRSNTAIIQDEPLLSSESQSAKESTQMLHNPPRQPPLRRSDSEGATQLQGLFDC